MSAYDYKEPGSLAEYERVMAQLEGQGGAHPLHLFDAVKHIMARLGPPSEPDALDASEEERRTAILMAAASWLNRPSPPPTVGEQCRALMAGKPSEDTPWPTT